MQLRMRVCDGVNVERMKGGDLLEQNGGRRGGERMGAAAARARVCVEMWRGESIYNLAFKKIFYRFRPLCFDDKRIQEKCCAPAKGGRHLSHPR